MPPGRSWQALATPAKQPDMAIEHESALGIPRHGQRYPSAPWQAP
jgi:hypothetical protein